MRVLATIFRFNPMYARYRYMRKYGGFMLKIAKLRRRLLWDEWENEN
jgi:hypothetical protein